MKAEEILKFINKAIDSDDNPQTFAPHCWLKKNCKDESCPVRGSFGEICWEQNKHECENCSYKKSLSTEDVLLLNIEKLCAKCLDFKRKALIYKQILEASQPVFKLGQEVRKVSHEINNIIGTMSGYAQLTTLTSDGKYLNQLLNIVSQGCKRISDILSHLKKIRKNAELSLECPADTFKEVFDSMFVEIQQKNIDWDVKSKEKVWMLAKPLPLQKLAFLSIKNAIDALENNGKIFVKVESKDRQVLINLLLQKLPTTQNVPYQPALPLFGEDSEQNFAITFDEAKFKSLIQAELSELNATATVKQDASKIKIQLVLPML